jgi:hypothetical protein
MSARSIIAKRQDATALPTITASIRAIFSAPRASFARIIGCNTSASAIELPNDHRLKPYPMLGDNGVALTGDYIQSHGVQVVDYGELEVLSFEFPRPDITAFGVDLTMTVEVPDSTTLRTDSIDGKGMLTLPDGRVLDLVVEWERGKGRKDPTPLTATQLEAEGVRLVGFVSTRLVLDPE